MGKVHKIKRKTKKIIDAKLTGRYYVLGFWTIYFGKSHYGNRFMQGSGEKYKGLVKWMQREYLGGSS